MSNDTQVTQHTSVNNSDVSSENQNSKNFTTGENTTWHIYTKSNDAQNTNSKSLYSVKIVIDKSAPSTPSLPKAIKAAYDEGLKRFSDSFKNNFSCNIHDGDEEHPSNANPEKYKGKYYFYANSNKKPIIVDEKLNLLQDNTTTYSNQPITSGQGPVSIEFYPYSHSGKNGITCSVNALMLKKPADYCIGEEARNYAVQLFSQFIEK